MTIAFQGSSSASKIHDVTTLLPLLEAHRRSGEIIVFTNGCFDLLHAGHVEVLEQARSLGGVLVVALNTDRSVSAIKGPLRPIVPQDNRARVMAALSCVTYVTFFDTETPEDLIRKIVPDVLVKGGDWTPDKIVGSHLVLERGGMVRSIPLVPDSSTTGLIDRVIDRYAKNRD